MLPKIEHNLTRQERQLLSRVAGKHGEIVAHSADELAAVTQDAGIFAKLLAIPGVRALPDVPLTATFFPRGLPAVGELLELKRSRSPSEDRVVASVTYRPDGERQTWVGG